MPYSSRRAIVREMIIILALLIVTEGFIWFFAIGPFLAGRDRASFLAEKDPGSFLIPATCLSFHGREGVDFVRTGAENTASEICWYTRRGFSQYFTPLDAANEAGIVKQQSERMKSGTFQGENSPATPHRTVSYSLRMLAACLPALLYLLYLFYRLPRKRDGDAPDENGRRWRIRDR